VEAGGIAHATPLDLTRTEPEAAGRVLLLQLLAHVGQLSRRTRRGLARIAARTLDALLQFAESLLDLAPLLRQAFQVLETHARRGLLLPLVLLALVAGRIVARARGRAQVLLRRALLLGQLPRAIGQ